MEPSLTSIELAGLQVLALFLKLDVDSSGSVTVMELKKNLEALQEALPTKVAMPEVIRALNKVSRTCRLPWHAQLQIAGGAQQSIAQLCAGGYGWELELEQARVRSLGSNFDPNRHTRNTSKPSKPCERGDSRFIIGDKIPTHLCLNHSISRV